MSVMLFDLDGTLLDTLEDIGDACNAMLQAHRYPPHPLPAYSRMIGNGFRMLVRRALPQDILPALPASDLDSLLAEAMALYASRMTEKTRPYPGIAETLRQLAQRGITLAVLSNKPEENCRVLIRHFFPDIPFAQVRGGRAGIPLKPDPAPVRAILREPGLNTATRRLYVGDSLVDIQTAQNAGLPCAAVSWGFTPPEILRAHTPRYLVTAPEQLLGIFAPGEDLDKT